VKSPAVVDPSRLDYYPLVLESTDDYRVPMAGVPLKSSFRIPGAMAIDPYVRALAQATGMRVSENAVWLLVVAMREYVEAILRNCIGSKNAMEAGELPPFPLIRQRVLHKKRDIGDHKREMSSASGQNPDGGPVYCISALDLYVLTSGMSVGSARSVGGSISRIAFEQSLFSSLEPSVSPGGSASDDVRKFITTKLKPSATTRLVSASTTAKDTAADPSHHVSAATAGQVTNAPAPPTVGISKPVHGGLGRGAKDLAAIKARTSSLKSTQQGDLGTGSPGATAPSSNSQSPTAPPGSSPSGTANAPSPAAPAPVAPTVPSTEKKSPVAQGVRLGRGSGVKNLAAMRARSITQKPTENADSKNEPKKATTESSEGGTPAEATGVSPPTSKPEERSG